MKESLLIYFNIKFWRKEVEEEENKRRKEPINWQKLNTRPRGSTGSNAVLQPHHQFAVEMTELTR